jgi:hypothetical protein
VRSRYAANLGREHGGGQCLRPGRQHKAGQCDVAAAFLGLGAFVAEHLRGGKAWHSSGAPVLTLASDDATGRVRQNSLGSDMVPGFQGIIWVGDHWPFGILICSCIVRPG